MPLYVNLYKFTDQGRKTIKQSPKRLKELTKTLEKTLGVKIVQALYTTGRYDIIVISEASGDRAALTAAAMIAQAGNVVGETLHAFTADQMERVVSKLS